MSLGLGIVHTIYWTYLLVVIIENDLRKLSLLEIWWSRKSCALSTYIENYYFHGFWDNFCLCLSVSAWKLCWRKMWSIKRSLCWILLSLEHTWWTSSLEKFQKNLFMHEVTSGFFLQFCWEFAFCWSLLDGCCNTKWVKGTVSLRQFCPKNSVGGKYKQPGKPMSSLKILSETNISNQLKLYLVIVRIVVQNFRVPSLVML